MFRPFIPLVAAGMVLIPPTATQASRTELQLIKPVCDVAGFWRMQVRGVGQSEWVLKPLGAGRYRAEEHGLDRGFGTAKVQGLAFRVDWGADQAGVSGVHDLTLSGDCKTAEGTLTLRGDGRARTMRATWRRNAY